MLMSPLKFETQSAGQILPQDSQHSNINHSVNLVDILVVCEIIFRLTLFNALQVLSHFYDFI